jgi:TIR domain
MKVFVSWSGERGRYFADAVCRLLTSAGGAPPLEPWMSTQIRQGRLWASELLAQLAECRACIVCVTADTVASHWLGFEAGAVLGAGAEVARVVCLGLDLDPGMLDGHLLSRFPLFDPTAAGMRALWEVLEPGTGPTWSAEDWREFERGCQEVPSAVPRAFTLWLELPDGLSGHPVQVDRDFAFDEVLTKLLEYHGRALTADERRVLRCLDIDAGRWVPMPSRLSTVSSRRLVLMDPHWAQERYHDSDRLATSMLRESIDVIPKVNKALASLRRDLRDLLASQVAFHAKSGRYAERLEELDFVPAVGNEIEMIGGPQGFAARGRSEGGASMHAVRLGDGAGQFEGQPAGVVFAIG